MSVYTYMHVFVLSDICTTEHLFTFRMCSEALFGIVYIMSIKCHSMHAFVLSDIYTTEHVFTFQMCSDSLYAIVEFLDENGAMAVVCSSWLHRNNKVCISRPS